MAFKHPSFLEVVAAHGIPFVYTMQLDPALSTYDPKQLMVIYHKAGDMDHPVSGSVGTQGLVNIWGKFVFPEKIDRPHGAYIRIPKLDREIIRRLEDIRMNELMKMGTVKRRVNSDGHRIIDLEGLT